MPSPSQEPVHVDSVPLGYPIKEKTQACDAASRRVDARRLPLIFGALICISGFAAILRGDNSIAEAVGTVGEGICILGALVLPLWALIDWLGMRTMYAELNELHARLRQYGYMYSSVYDQFYRLPKVPQPGDQIASAAPAGTGGTG